MHHLRWARGPLARICAAPTADAGLRIGARTTIAKVAADLDVDEADDADSEEMALLEDGAAEEAGESPETGE